MKMPTLNDMARDAQRTNPERSSLLIAASTEVVLRMQADAKKRKDDLDHELLQRLKELVGGDMVWSIRGGIYGSRSFLRSYAERQEANSIAKQLLGIDQSQETARGHGNPRIERYYYQFDISSDSFVRRRYEH